MLKFCKLNIAFNLAFIFAILIAIAHLFFIFESIFTGQLYIDIRLIDSISFIVYTLLIISLFKSSVFKYYISLIFYIFLFISTFYATSFIHLLKNAMSLNLSSSEVFIVFLGLILPLFGVAVSAISLRFSKGKDETRNKS